MGFYALVGVSNLCSNCLIFASSWCSRPNWRKVVFSVFLPTIDAHAPDYISATLTPCFDCVLIIVLNKEDFGSPALFNVDLHDRRVGC